MEHHPIPQDITGFQFKLIGEMTVKQFAYLTAGAILAIIMFYTPLLFILKAPLVLLSAGLGAALAFLPVEGRPLDVMLSYYFKALFSPTQYVYQKTGHTVSSSTPFNQQISAPTQAPQPVLQQMTVAPAPMQTRPQQPLEDFLAQIQQQNKQAANTQTAPTLPSTQTMQAQPPLEMTSPVAIQQQAVPQPAYDTGNTYSYAAHGAQIISMHGDEPQVQTKQLEPDEEKEQEKEAVIDTAEKDLEKEELKVQKELAEAKLAEQQQQTQDTSKAAHEKTSSLQDKLQEIAMQKERLEQELMNLKKQFEASQQEVHSVAQLPTQETNQPQPSGEPAKPVSGQVRQIPRPQTKAVGLPQVNDPNIIAGVVKDSRGNLLPNILVEIIDSQNNPVRAFKTNQLGQFLSATQLPNGTYRMSFEDPKAQQRFDIIEIQAKGDIMLPLEIVSHDEREALRKELFS